MMKRALRKLAPLLLGLLVAQLVATLQVYFSNAAHHRTLLVLKEAGYLIVPNQLILPRLLSFDSAFWGAVFFTLSIGVSLSFLSWSAAWCWNRLFSRNRFFLLFCFLAWVTSLVLINGRGFCLFITLHFLFVPTIVFAAAARLPAQNRDLPRHRSLLLPAPLLVLTLLWTTQLNGDFFLNLRDKVLLSNSVGKKVSAFYYGYAYFPAEAFKSLDQKLLKSCSFSGLQRKPVEPALERTLIYYDYLPVGEARDPADLDVREDNGLLFFEHRGRTIFQTSLQEFLARPGKLLAEFSRETDTCSPFRRFTLFSLLVSLPLVLYAVCFSLFFLISSCVVSPRISSWVASVLCLLAGTSFFFYIQRGVGENSIEPATALASEHWETRVAGLKAIEQERLDIRDFEAYPRLMKSPHVAERYWFVRTLGFSRGPSTYGDLLGFLYDPDACVVSMAFYALGQRKDSRAVPEILKRIETSGDWYNQWYAYRALRNLGWRQSRLR